MDFGYYQRVKEGLKLIRRTKGGYKSFVEFLIQNSILISYCACHFPKTLILIKVLFVNYQRHNSTIPVFNIRIVSFTGLFP